MWIFSKGYLVVIFGTGVLFSLALFSWTDQSLMSVLKILPRKDRLDQSPSNIQDLRLKRLHDTCNKYRHLMKKKSYRKRRPQYLTSEEYKWTFCKIGKVGSTFWSRFFYILTHSGRDVYKVRQLTRDELHGDADLSSNSHKDPRSYPTRLVLTVRNPYTRLFSAYIDRIFTTSTTPLTIGKNGGTCKSQISFKEFLKFAVDSFYRRKYDYHWGPLFYRCKPCEIDPTYIFKVESFRSDFSTFVNLSEIEPYKRDVLTKVLAEDTDLSISTLIDDILDTTAPNNQHHALDCQSMKQITVRLWESLKIQGYVAESAPFPFNKYQREEDFNNSNIFRDILVETRQSYPLTKSEISSQRLRSLNRFYEKIDKDIIKSIQKIYSTDFDLFGYSYDPPPW